MYGHDGSIEVGEVHLIGSKRLFRDRYREVRNLSDVVIFFPKVKTKVSGEQLTEIELAQIHSQLK